MPDKIPGYDKHGGPEYKEHSELEDRNCHRWDRNMQTAKKESEAQRTLETFKSTKAIGRLK